MQTFARASRFVLGYSLDQVDAFFDGADEVTAEQARTAAFDLVRGGYQVAPVDDALDQLEDVLARGERQHNRAQLGEGSFVQQLTADAGALRDRLGRLPADRFVRAGFCRRGYDIDAVDALCDRLSAYLDGAALTTGEVRGCMFDVARGSRAYDEAAVDALLDQVVSVMSRAH